MSDTDHTEPRPMSALSPDELRTEIRSRTWFHTIDLGNGIRTPGQKDTPSEVHHFQIPADLTGKTVLDIGAYDGFYSFEAERRGAARVVAADSWAWNWPGSDARRNFELAHEVLGSKVESVVVPVEELSPERVGGVFDVVFFLGVLYHAPGSDRLPPQRAQRHRRDGHRGDRHRPDRRPRAGRRLLPGRLVQQRRQQPLRPQRAGRRGMAGHRRLRVGGVLPGVEPNQAWGLQHAYAPKRRRLSIPSRLRRQGPRSGRMVFHARP